MASKFVAMYEELIQTPGLWVDGYMDRSFVRFHIILQDSQESDPKL